MLMSTNEANSTTSINSTVFWILPPILASNQKSAKISSLLKQNNKCISYLYTFFSIENTTSPIYYFVALLLGLRILQSRRDELVGRNNWGTFISHRKSPKIASIWILQTLDGRSSDHVLKPQAIKYVVKSDAKKWHSDH